MKKFQKYYSISFLFFQTVLLILVSNTCLKAQDKNELKISFWNVENLFDIFDDPIKNDEEFSIGGRKNVTQEIYDLKLENCSEVLQDLNADVLGICEVENRFMLEELNRSYLDRDYSIVHYDSPDNRGIDCALLYDKKVFTLLESKPIRNTLPGNLSTRDILHAKGLFEGELLHIGIKEGETAPVDSLLAILGNKGEDISKLIQINDDINEEFCITNIFRSNSFESYFVICMDYIHYVDRFRCSCLPNPSC